MAAPFERTTRALARDNGAPAILAMSGAILLLSLWLGWFAFGAVTVYEPSRHARLESASAPRDITALQSGRLANSILQPGRRVRAGEILAELDTASATLSDAEEGARLEAYPAKISTLRLQIAALRLAMANDGHAAQAAGQAAAARVREAAAASAFALDTERRMRRESEAGGVAEIEALRAASEARKTAAARDALAADARRAEMDARARSSQNQAQIEDLTRQLVSMESDANASRATASRLKLDIEDRRIRAPVDGIIGEAQPIRSGAYVAQGQKLATILPEGGLVVVAEFDPASALGRVQTGQTARLRLDGFPWAQYGVVEAKVSRVSGEVRDGGLRVELTPILQTASNLALRHGLTGGAEIIIEKVPPAVLVLRAAGQMLSGRARIVQATP